MVLDFTNLYDFPRRFESMFDEFMNPLSISQRRMAYPPVNVNETDEKIIVRAVIPGMSIKDIDLTLTESSLVIKGERKTEEGRYFRQERPTGFFQRVINLNIKIDRDKIKATMKNGLLNIYLPKAEEVKPRQINIKVEE
ncbi:MAG: Hsp20/alpha crystallin family protein [Desulfohalobiaceae bacterium]|nr:Hsp20/alpha crystallin family protein [Desulfohalobiaceae bacterium]